MINIVNAIKKEKPKMVEFTEAYQSYFSAGDESEPYCPICEEILEDETSYCPHCGQALQWECYPSRWYIIKQRIKRFFKKKDSDIWC